MKIAIHNTFYGGKLAETELSRRLVLAAKNLGWDAIEVGVSDVIRQYEPDFVLTLHFKTPKLTPFPTYGCLWHPVVLVETDERFIRNTLSYDGYLSSSPTTDLWLRDRLYNTPKNFFIAPFFTSCNSTIYREPQLQTPRLMYVGSNWDGERFKALFLELEKQQCIDIYGSQDGWAYLRSSYKSDLPFDGTSVLDQLNQAGAGLCLHREEHTREGVPSMRIFEIAASGAIAICGDHSFIKTHFADTVLYVDINQRVVDQAAQVKSHLEWIANHQKTALEMSRAAHDIFLNHFSLEKLLSNLQTYHQNLIQAKGFVCPASPLNNESHSSFVELILKVRDRDTSNLKKTLESIQQQTYSNVSILLINDNDQNPADISDLLNIYENKLRVKTFNRQGATSSSYFWRGIQTLAGQYFGILTSGVVLHPNHIATLVSLLDRFPQLGLAYSEVIQTGHQNDLQKLTLNDYEILEQAALATPQLADLEELISFNHFTNTNSFLARSALVDEWLQQDPQLEVLDDLFLLINLGARGSGMFSYEATCEVNVDPLHRPNLSAPQQHQQIEELQRIRKMMGDREFATGRSASHAKPIQRKLHQAEAELQQVRQRVLAMETSKFWQLRKQWFQLKRSLGLNTDDE